MPLLRADEETGRRWPTRVLRVLEILVWLHLAVLVWIGASGGRVFQIGSQKLSVTSSGNPSILLVVLLVLILWGRGWLGLCLRRTFAAFLRSNWAGRLGIVVASIGAVYTLSDYGRIPTAFGNALIVFRTGR